MASPYLPPRPASCCASLRGGWRVSSTGPIVFLLLAASSVAWSAGQRPNRRHVQDPWEHAVAVRQGLEDLLPQQRTRELYEAALDAFRVIYHEDPGGAK